VLFPLAEAELETAGGKAAGLRRLLDLGLPVPEGFCLPFAIYRQALPGELPGPCPDLRQAEATSLPVREALLRWRPSPSLRAALVAARARLGSAPVVVRSSASCEDQRQPSAGLFTSTAGVRNLEELLEAVRRCWSSLWEVPAWAGLKLTGRSPAGEAMAVVVQTEVEARWGGLLLTRDPGDESRLRIEATPRSGAGLAAGEQDPEVILLAPEPAPLPTPASLPLELLAFLRRSAARLERALGGPLELEWAFDGRQTWLLQLRRTELRAAPRAFPLRWRRPEEEGLLWRWDREHNPDPLSVAHQSLIELLEADGPPRLMVQGGYLYTTSAVAEVEGREELGPLWERLDTELEVAEVKEAELAEAGPSPGDDPDAGRRLERALASFRTFYASYAGSLTRARRHARRGLAELLGSRDAAALEPTLLLGTLHSTQRRTEELWQLAQRLRDEPELLEELRRGPSLPPTAPSWLRQAIEQHLLRWGCLMRRWDLASPTLAEEPEHLIPRLLSLTTLEEDPRLARRRGEERASHAEEELRARLPARERDLLASRLETARLARRLEEDDDLLFARALGLVRRALLEGGAALQRRGELARTDEVFLLGLTEIGELLRGGAAGHERARGELAEELGRRRQALEANRELLPPLTIHGDRLTWLPPPGRAVLTGAGVGGLARGPVRLAASLEDLLGLDARGAVVVCPTLLPSLAVVLAEAAALVTDHGGLLSHAASLARELGVPAVVGTGTATRDLRPGEIVWVDGSRGLVVREG